MAPAMAQPPSSVAEPIGEISYLYALGEGMAAATVIGAHPVRVERLKGNAAQDSAIEKRYFAAHGLRVVAFKFPQADFYTVTSVEVTTSAALRQINHAWPQMNRAAIIANFGTPVSQTATSIRYKGSAEICSDFMDIGLKDGKMASITWTFCAD